MIQNALKDGMQPAGPEARPFSGATMTTCPMGRMCVGMMKKQHSGWFLMLPGILLIILGVLIVVEPRILVWFIAAATVLFGAMMLIMASFIHKMVA